MAREWPMEVMSPSGHQDAGNMYVCVWTRRAGVWIPAVQEQQISLERGVFPKLLCIALCLQPCSSCSVSPISQAVLCTEVVHLLHVGTFWKTCCQSLGSFLWWLTAQVLLSSGSEVHPHQADIVPWFQPGSWSVAEIKKELQTVPSIRKQWPSCTVQVFLSSLYNSSSVIANTTQFSVQWTDANVELSLEGELGWVLHLEVSWGSRSRMGAMHSEDLGDLITSADLWGQVLLAGAVSGPSTAEHCEVAQEQINSLLGLAWLLPEGQINRWDQRESNQKDK